MNETVSFPARFKGPPDSANGGWACGVIASLSDEPVAVELRAPPPLERPLHVVRSDSGIEVMDGDTLVARAVPVDPPPLEAPAVVELDEAAAASDGYPGFDEHPFPDCFVCGPDRTAGDGLRIFPGPVEGSDVLAATWTPGPTNSDDGATLSPLHARAALDCPSGWAVSVDGSVSVLARLAATLTDEPIPLLEPLIAIGWHDRSDGRKRWSGAALLRPDGTVVGRSDALWIELKD